MSCVASLLYDDVNWNIKHIIVNHIVDTRAYKESANEQKLALSAAFCAYIDRLVGFLFVLFHARLLDCTRLLWIYTLKVIYFPCFQKSHMTKILRSGNSLSLPPRHQKYPENYEIAQNTEKTYNYQNTKTPRCI